MISRQLLIFLNIYIEMFLYVFNITIELNKGNNKIKYYACFDLEMSSERTEESQSVGAFCFFYHLRG
jgi:hypothetical protein